MQFTKPMIELVYEIRRRVSAQDKPAVKLANPELLPTLAGMARASSCDTITTALIKELMTLAGGDWPLQLATNAAPVERQNVRAYRGQVSHQEAQSDVVPAPARPQRIYRGRVVGA